MNSTSRSWSHTLARHLDGFAALIAESAAEVDASAVVPSVANLKA